MQYLETLNYRPLDIFTMNLAALVFCFIWGLHISFALKGYYDIIDALQAIIIGYLYLKILDKVYSMVGMV